MRSAHCRPKRSVFRTIMLLLMGCVIGMPRPASAQATVTMTEFTPEASALLRVLQLRIHVLGDSTPVDVCSLRRVFPTAAAPPSFLARTMGRFLTAPTFAGCGSPVDVAPSTSGKRSVLVDSLRAERDHAALWLTVRSRGGVLSEHHFLTTSLSGEVTTWRHDSVTIIHRPGVELYPTLFR